MMKPRLSYPSNREPVYASNIVATSQPLAAQAVGWLPVTVPGAVSTWSTLHERFGELPFEALFESAIHYARNGFLLSPQTAFGFDRGIKKYASCEAWKKTFLVDGKVPTAGTLIKLPNHAETLKEIAMTHGDSFYQGAIADKIEKASIEQGGYLRKVDLESHQPIWVKPISINVDGHIFSELPPNGQGIAALIAMKILQQLDIDLSKVDDPEVLHAQIEAMKCAFAYDSKIQFNCLPSSWRCKWDASVIYPKQL